MGTYLAMPIYGECFDVITTVEFAEFASSEGLLYIFAAPSCHGFPV